MNNGTSPVVASADRFMARVHVLIARHWTWGTAEYSVSSGVCLATHGTTGNTTVCRTV
jgi:hypothetical protein